MSVFCVFYLDILGQVKGLGGPPEVGRHCILDFSGGHVQVDGRGRGLVQLQLREGERDFEDDRNVLKT